jgi:hypothetical protein
MQDVILQDLVKLLGQDFVLKTNCFYKNPNILQLNRMSTKIRVYAKGAGTGQKKPEDPYDGEIMYEPLESIEEKDLPPGPPISRQPAIRCDEHGNIITEGTIPRDYNPLNVHNSVNTTPSVQRSMTTHGSEDLNSNTQLPANNLPGVSIVKEDENPK